MSGPPFPVVPRLDRARERMRAAAVDALVVSHLPNIRYLTGFAGSAGLVVLTPGQCVLVVDFRYQTVARSLVQSRPDVAATVTVVVPARNYDETLAEVLRETGARRIGIEGAWMSVSRFNRLSSALAGSAPTPLRSPDGCPALVATERIIEAERVVKDEVEIATLQEAGRRLGEATAEAVGLRSAGPDGARDRRRPRRAASPVGFRAPGVRDDRRVRAEQRAATRAARRADAPGG